MASQTEIMSLKTALRVAFEKDQISAQYYYEKLRVLNDINDSLNKQKLKNQQKIRESKKLFQKRLITT